MIYLKSWLEEYINLEGLDTWKLGELISEKSGEVEEITKTRDYFNGKVLVGKLFDVKKHENADKLKVFKVDLGLGKEPIQIVSAAENVREGLVCPVATIGCQLAFLNIAERKMRGEVSQGMCLGKSELMLETEMSPGLWELDTEYPNHNFQLGESLCLQLPELFPEETIIDIKYLQDRLAHFGNHLGLALDLAVITKEPQRLKPKAQRLLDPELFLKEFQHRLVNLKKSSSNIDFRDTTGYTNQFLLLDLEFKKEGFYTLPHTLQRRMFLTGRNLIGGLADISNYLQADIGQPSHFFSLQKLNGGALPEGDYNFKWGVSKLEDNTPFQGLGQLKNSQIPVGVEVLKQDDLDQPIAIPAISGSALFKTEYNENRVIIEVANFEQERVAESSFSLGYRSDAARLWNAGVQSVTILLWLVHFIELMHSETESQLEERGWDYNGFKLELLCNWINPESDLQKTTQSSENLLEFANYFVKSLAQTEVKIDQKNIQARLDSRDENFWNDEINTALNLIGSYNNSVFQPRIFYQPALKEEDLLFEVARIHGLTNLERQPLSIPATFKDNGSWEAAKYIRETITKFGFNQIVSRPFLTADEVEAVTQLTPGTAFDILSSKFHHNRNKLQNSLLPNLISCLASNINQGHKKPDLFEFTKLYESDKTRVLETWVAGLISADNDPHKLVSLVYKLGSVDTCTKFEIPDLASGYKYVLKNGITARLLELSNKYKKDFFRNWPKRVWYLELDLTNWDQKLNTYPKYTDETDYPKLTRAYSLKVPKNLKLNDLISLKTKLKSDFQIDIEPVERLYEEGFDILNIANSYWSYDKTLDSQEVESWEKAFFEEIKTNWPAVELR